MTLKAVPSVAFETALATSAREVDSRLDSLLPKEESAGRLAAAMRHAVLAGGKRLRPFLTLEVAHLFGVARDRALRAAAAVECVHAYSLVHDDLPAMDDDDLRRGQPTVHKAFDEATAILAGDALLTLAFEIMSDVRTHEDPFVRAELVTRLAQAAGWMGMVGGQMLDLAAATTPLDEMGITRMQRMKTGALISFACEAGAVLGHVDRPRLQALQGYAHDLGLAFQIQDDVLDAEGDAREVGKSVRKDPAQGKATFVSILGLDGAKRRAIMLAEQAVTHLRAFDSRADLLRAAAGFAIDRGR